MLRAISSFPDVRFEEGTFDVRNWVVKTQEDAERIGKVDDLLIDEGGQTRYICVDLEAEHKHVLVPSGQVRAERANEVVWIPGVKRERLAAVPEYPHQPEIVDDEYERRIADAYEHAYATGAHYERPEYAGRAWEAPPAEERRTAEEPIEPAGHRLEKLGEESDMTLAPGVPDPRGWDVYGVGAEKLGEIEYLLNDPDARRIRYLVMRTDRSTFGEAKDIPIPVGHVDLREESREVRVAAMDRSLVECMPEYDESRFDRAREEEILEIYARGCTGERAYEHPRYRDEELFAREEGEVRVPRTEEELEVGKRETAGEVGIHKRVETERVREPVRVHREEVEIERRPVTGEARAEEIGPDEVRVPVHGEEVAVETRPVTREEVVVRKRPVEEERVVEADVRKERVEIEESGDVEKKKP